jgi:hypothetical protein
VRLNAIWHRYGIMIMVIPQGTWFWDHLFEVIDFVPTGKRTSRDSYPLRHNSLHGALSEAIKRTPHVIERLERGPGDRATEPA